MDGNKRTYDLPCEVVQDLLPLYCEGLVSEKTANAVDAHLEGCEDCRKECEIIRTALPVEDAKPATAGKFAEMMKKLRIRRLLVIALTAILSCAVLASGFWGLTQVPVRQLGPGHITVEKVHVYEDKGETHMFIWYLVPMWNSPTFQNMYVEETSEPGVWALKNEFKVGIVSKRFDKEKAWDAVWDLLIEADYEDVKAITFEGETIWDAKSAKSVPDYVMAYRDYAGPMNEFNGMTVDADKNLIGFDNAEEKRFIYWDIDGNLLYEGDGKDADKVIDFDVPLDLADYPPVIE